MDNDASWTKKHGKSNHRIARISARVEQVFGAIDQLGDMLIRTIGQARANIKMTLIATCFNLMRWVYLRRAGIAAF